MTREQWLSSLNGMSTGQIVQLAEYELLRERRDFRNKPICAITYSPLNVKDDGCLELVADFLQILQHRSIAKSSKTRYVQAAARAQEALIRLSKQALACIRPAKNPTCIYVRPDERYQDLWVVARSIMYQTLEAYGPKLSLEKAFRSRMSLLGGHNEDYEHPTGCRPEALTFAAYMDSYSNIGVPLCSDVLGIIYSYVFQY
jgi:hypothetical protein